MGQWRHGIRPGAIGAAVVAVLVAAFLPLFPQATALQRTTWLVGFPAGTFGLIVALYASGGVARPDDSHRTSPGIVLLAVVGLAALLLSECF